MIWWATELRQFKEHHGIPKSEDIGTTLEEAMLECATLGVPKCYYCQEKYVELFAEGGSSVVVPTNSQLTQSQVKDGAVKIRTSYYGDGGRFRVPGYAPTPKIKGIVNDFGFLRRSRLSPATPTTAPKIRISSDEAFRLGLEIDEMQSRIRTIDRLLSTAVGDAWRKDLETERVEVLYDLGRLRGKLSNCIVSENNEAKKT